MKLQFFIRICLGALLIVSGLLKLYPTEFFENQLLTMGVINATGVQWLARLIIATEIALGLFLMFNLALRFTIRSTAVMLGVYTLWLLYDWFILGNHENCGCFGSKVPLTPAQAIVKNVGMLLLLIPLKSNPEWWSARMSRWLLVSGTVVALAVPMILSPPMFGHREAIAPELQKPLDYQRFGMPADIAEGNTLVCFFLSGCKHCRISAARVQALTTDHPEWPVHVVLAGPEVDRADFIHESKYTGRLHTFDDAAELVQYTGHSFPIMVLMTNGVPKELVTMYDLNEIMLQNWFDGNN